MSASFAEHVVIDQHRNTVTIDGQEIPWLLLDAPDLTLPKREDVGTVTLTIPCERIEVIPAMGASTIDDGLAR